MLKRSHLTTTSIALLAFGIAGCLVFAVVGELLARVIQYDVFKLLAQFFIVTVLGGGSNDGLCRPQLGEGEAGAKARDPARDAAATHRSV